MIFLNCANAKTMDCNTIPIQADRCFQHDCFVPWPTLYTVHRSIHRVYRDAIPIQAIRCFQNDCFVQNKARSLKRHNRWRSLVPFQRGDCSFVPGANKERNWTDKWQTLKRCRSVNFLCLSGSRRYNSRLVGKYSCSGTLNMVDKISSNQFNCR